MKTKKTIAVISTTLILVAIICISAIATTAENKNWISDAWKTEGQDATDVVKYEKKSISEIVDEGGYPEEKSPDANVGGNDRWEAFITYSAEPIFEFKESKTKRKLFYDPYIYTDSLIMEVEGDDGKWSSSNSVSFTHSKSTTIDHGVDMGLSIESFFSKFKVSFGFSVNISKNTTEQSTVTFNAVYFNPSGSPCQWKIIGYRVYLPIKVVTETLANGEWVQSENTDYWLLPTIKGECRSWISNGNVFYEHWATGEPVSWDDFFDGFTTKEEMAKWYIKKLYPYLAPFLPLFDL